MVGRIRSVSNAGRSSVDAGTLTVPAPSGIADNDWLIAIGAASGSPNGTIALPAGFTAYSTGHSFRVAGYKLAASESGNYDFACGNPDDDAAWRAGIIAVSGCDPAVPPAIGTVTTATNSTPTGAGVTLAFGHAVLMMVVLEGADNDNENVSAFPPAGFHEILDQRQINNAGNAGQVMIAAFVANEIKLGATGNKVATLNHSRSNTAFLLTFTHPTIAGTAPGPVETLIEMDTYDEGVPGVVTKRYSRRGMIYPDHTIYEPRLMSEIRLQQHGSGVIAFGGRVALTAAEIDLRNDDLVFDDIVSRNLAVGRDVTIKTMQDGNPWAASDGGGGALSGAVTVFKGVVSGFGGPLRPDERSIGGPNRVRAPRTRERRR